MSRASPGLPGICNNGGHAHPADCWSSPTTAGFSTKSQTTTWEVHDGIVEPFDGGYAAYVLQAGQAGPRGGRPEAKRQNLMRKELAWLRQARAHTSKPEVPHRAANQLIEDVPPIRNTVELAKLATSRLGKDVIDLLDVSVTFGTTPVLRDIEWRIARANELASSALTAPESPPAGVDIRNPRPGLGRVKRGKTVKLGTLDQQAGIP